MWGCAFVASMELEVSRPRTEGGGAGVWGCAFVASMELEVSRARTRGQVYVSVCVGGGGCICSQYGTGGE